MSPRITAAICTYNRARYLPGAIDSLLKQSLPPSEYEVLIVDNNSTDGTPAIIRRYLDNPGAVIVRHCAEPVQGLSHARNLAVKMAAGEIIAFLDDDALASPHWLAALLDAYTAFPDAWAGGGPVEPIWQAPRPAWLTDALLVHLAILDYGDTLRLLEPRERVVGANCSFRREALATVGLFDPVLGRRGQHLFGSEETDLEQRIHDHGHPIFYAPAARVGHVLAAPRLQRRYFLRLAQGKGQTAALRTARSRGRRSTLRKALGLSRATVRSCLSCLVTARHTPHGFQCAWQVAHLAGYWAAAMVCPAAPPPKNESRARTAR